MATFSKVSNFSKTQLDSGGVKPFIGYRNFYGSGKSKYFIYPDGNWNVKDWGKKPLLGTVYADEPFYAVREAYTKGLVPLNFSFGLVALKEKLDEEQTTSRRYTK
jgi:hypothetical protein